MKLPRWLDQPSWRPWGRRWSDDGHHSRLDSARRAISAVWPFIATAAALSIVAASMVTMVTLFNQRDTSRVAAAAAKVAAERAAAGAADIRQLLLAQVGLARINDERRAAAVAVVKADTIAALADHDRRVQSELDDVLDRLGRLLGRPVPPTRPVTPLTTRPGSAAAPPVTSPAVPPSVAPTPTSRPPACPQLPNGKCRP